jgi:hypothetical protein
MSQDFVKVLVKDSRLDCTDAVSYAVHKGGQNMTAAQFQAISATPSSITFNIQVPSEQTIIDRRVMWRSTVLLALDIIAPAGVNPINLAVADALAAFPLHQLTSVMTATINNNSVSLNVRDVLPALLRFHDRRELARYNGMTPTMFDLLANYADGVGANLNSLGSWANAADNDLLARGAFQLDGISCGPSGLTSLPPPLLPTPAQIAAGWNFNNANSTIYIQFTVSEPLLLSPFIWADPQSNNQGFYGVQNMNFVFNIGDATRVWRTANANLVAGNNPFNQTYIKGARVQAFSNTSLLFNFLTPHPSDLFPARNAVPYWEAPRFITSPNKEFGAYNPTSTSSAAPAIEQLTTSSLQLNQIPDKLIIQVRNPLGSSAWGQPDAFLTIKGISINFNNQSGILASATTQDLYRYSVENGYNGSWQEFNGLATVADPTTGFGRKIPTSGSLLILEFGKDIQLTEDYYASGSLGNFNLQINLQVANQFPYAITPEIVIITVNSGLFVNERGTSSTYTGILTKADVLAASAQEPYYQTSVKRMVGGGFLDSLKSVAGKVLPHLLKHGKEELGKSDHPVAKLAHSALGAMGYGVSGGGPSGGGPSGGGPSGGARMRLADRLMK